MPASLLLADRRRHLALFPARWVEMNRAELLRSIPDRPSGARLAISAGRQTSTLILAAFVRRSALKEKTEVESKPVHCQRPV